MQPDIGRPKATSPEIIRAAAERMVDQVSAWFVEVDGEAPPRETILSDLAREIRLGRDGYHVAKSMENMGWYPDAQLVEILAGSVYAIHSAHEAAVKAWVAANGIVLGIPVGAQVMTTAPYAPSGIVGGHMPETAQYVIREPGRKTDGCYIIDAERVTIAPEAEASDAA